MSELGDYQRTTAREVEADIERLRAEMHDLRHVYGSTPDEIRLEIERLTRESAARGIIIEMVREDMERILAAWAAPPGGQQCGSPDKRIPPSKCRELLRMLGEANAEWQYDQYTKRLTDAERRAETAERKLTDRAQCCAENERLLNEVAQSAVEFADPRVRYVAIQVEAETWEQIQQTAGGARRPAESPADYPGGSFSLSGIFSSRGLTRDEGEAYEQLLSESFGGTYDEEAGP